MTARKDKAPIGPAIVGLTAGLALLGYATADIRLALSLGVLGLLAIGFYAAVVRSPPTRWPEEKDSPYTGRGLWHPQRISPHILAAARHTHNRYPRATGYLLLVGFLIPAFSYLVLPRSWLLPLGAIFFLVWSGLGFVLLGRTTTRRR